MRHSPRNWDIIFLCGFNIACSVKPSYNGSPAGMQGSRAVGPPHPEINQVAVSGCLPNPAGFGSNQGLIV